MAIVFITGSTDGLGRAAAQSLLDQGHRVVLHARSADRAAALEELAPRAEAVVIGDLQNGTETRSIADQVNAIGRMDAVIHNAGIYTQPNRGSTLEGHASTLAINTVAPYILTALIERPARLVYLSSGLHRGGEGSLNDLDWTKRSWDAAKAYAESKLHVVALAFALARRWPQVLSNAVDPGWARTRMGGSGAPVDIATGQKTQTWLAVSNDPAALVSGRYWHNLQEQQPASEATDAGFQDGLVGRLRELTGVALPGS
ncbi:SDR family NAD(P)-dependent oxidoreductase [Bradyrhizobium sp. CIAT3101]|uniref:SDR family NAD(P)-dependent oxidoreductase n=1 Tax=Bradyrhizobium sp. CIAT3101 TaxID=439387 RepID=UPI0024B0CFB9|nr:SDR family NAD(P)-dependent oxidoreductase [Bradyrhizobium sp. CIAT3101]WFU78247.1 SDR family NAD(P)-dependent oxidoreductase [Bradyrhizobium sp. CIAT3101]